MATHHLVLIIHLLAATIWVGGHLILAIKYLPKAIKEKNPDILLSFEKNYEPVGMPSLLLLVITGIWMSYDFGIKVNQWFHFGNPLENVVSLKLLLLITTVLFALSAQLRIIPKLRKGDASKLPEMAFHAVSVTIIGCVMLILGSFVRYGGVNF